MYARVSVTTEARPNAVVVPRNAVINIDGKRGVFVATDQVASFRPLEFGIEDARHLEILSGISEGEKVVTTGAAALRDGDRILLAGAAPGGPGQGGPGQGRGPGRGPDPGGAVGPGSGGQARPGGPGRPERTPPVGEGTVGGGQRRNSGA
jgi:hypothetical protein